MHKNRHNQELNGLKSVDVKRSGKLGFNLPSGQHLKDRTDGNVGRGEAAVAVDKYRRSVIGRSIMWSCKHMVYKWSPVVV